MISAEKTHAVNNKPAAEPLLDRGRRLPSKVASSVSGRIVSSRAATSMSTNRPLGRLSIEEVNPRNLWILEGIGWTCPPGSAGHSERMSLQRICGLGSRLMLGLGGGKSSGRRSSRGMREQEKCSNISHQRESVPSC